MQFPTVPSYLHIHRLPKLEGRSVEDSVANVKERLWDVLKANWMVWPVAQVGVNDCIIEPY